MLLQTVDTDQMSTQFKSLARRSKEDIDEFAKVHNSYLNIPPLQEENLRKKHERSSASHKFYFRFEPGVWVSRYVVELNIDWHQSNGSIIHIGLTPVCERICTNIDIIRSLGLRECNDCLTRTGIYFCKLAGEGAEYPQLDPQEVRRYLESGELSANDSYYCEGWLDRRSIMEVRI